MSFARTLRYTKNLKHGLAFWLLRKAFGPLLPHLLHVSRHVPVCIYVFLREREGFTDPASGEGEETK